jgi:hypothetical protein
MEVEQVKRHKKLLESKLLELLNKFSEETGCNIFKIETFSVADLYPKITRVEIEVRL